MMVSSRRLFVTTAFAWATYFGLAAAGVATFVRWMLDIPWTAWTPVSLFGPLALLWLLWSGGTLNVWLLKRRDAREAAAKVIADRQAACSHMAGGVSTVSNVNGVRPGTRYRVTDYRQCMKCDMIDPPENTGWSLDGGAPDVRQRFDNQTNFGGFPNVSDLIDPDEVVEMAQRFMADTDISIPPPTPEQAQEIARALRDDDIRNQRDALLPTGRRRQNEPMPCTVRGEHEWHVREDITRRMAYRLCSDCGADEYAFMEQDTERQWQAYQGSPDGHRHEWLERRFVGSPAALERICGSCMVVQERDHMDATWRDRDPLRRASTLPRTTAAQEIEAMAVEAWENRNRVQPGAAPRKRRKINVEG